MASPGRENQWRTKRAKLALHIVAILAFTLSSCSKSSPSNSTTTIRVVAAENFYGDIVKQIGGVRVSVTSLISDPTTDPHVFEADAKSALAVYKAKLVIYNGLGYDDFFSKMLSSNPSRNRREVKAQSVVNKPSGSNPHLWYNLDYVTKIANNVSQQLSEIDAAHTSTFQSNLNLFLATLEPINQEIATIKNSYPLARVAYTERVPEYIFDEAGFDNVTPPAFAQANENGNDPSTSSVSALEQLIKSHSLKLLIYNSQAVSPASKHVRSLAEENRIPIVGVTETLPKNQTFAQWQLSQVNAINQALAMAQ